MAQDELWKCPECGKEFNKHSHGIGRHIKTHNYSEKWKCLICNKEFNVKNARHILMHNPEAMKLLSEKISESWTEEKRKKHTQWLLQLWQTEKRKEAAKNYCTPIYKQKMAEIKKKQTTSEQLEKMKLGRIKFWGEEENRKNYSIARKRWLEDPNNKEKKESLYKQISRTKKANFAAGRKNNMSGTQTPEARERRIITCKLRANERPKSKFSNTIYPWYFNKELKRYIYERDKYECTECHQHGLLAAHHIDENKENCSPFNLITLCKPCNTKASRNNKHKNEFYAKVAWEREMARIKEGKKFIPSWSDIDQLKEIWINMYDKNNVLTKKEKACLMNLQ